VTALDKQLIADGERSFWAVCITYQVQSEDQASPARKGKIDYREVLSADDFAVFAQLRILRKSIAEQQGVPVYALFSNEHLAEMVRRRVGSISALAEIEGIARRMR
jgi:superfamily II DNA helicase RecQ